MSRSGRRRPAGVITKTEYIAPSLNADGFHCPHCGVYAHQYWEDVATAGVDYKISGMRTARCRRCGENSVWHKQQMIFPVGATTAPLPHPDLFTDARRDYEEARAIANRSPRGAAALLRLVIQKICKALGESGNDLNDDIGTLVGKGLPSTIQKALDVVRVVGNNAVHPGQIDMRDNLKVAAKLFQLVNLIIEKMVSEPNEINAFFDNLPEGPKKQIARRDAGKSRVGRSRPQQQ